MFLLDNFNFNNHFLGGEGGGPCYEPLDPPPWKKYMDSEHFFIRGTENGPKGRNSYWATLQTQ